MEASNLLSNGDIYQMDYGYIHKIFKNYSRSSRKKGRNGKGTITKCSNTSIFIKNEI